MSETGGVMSRLGMLVLVASVSLGQSQGCSDDRRGNGDLASGPVCPGELEGADCIKECGLAVETTREEGVVATVVGSSGQPQGLRDLHGQYRVETFVINGAGITLDLPREILSDIMAARITFPRCVRLSELGAGDGLGQYMPRGNTFSTDQYFTGKVAILSYREADGMLEGIFEFDAAAGRAPAEGDPRDRLSVSIEQGYFKVYPDQQR